MQYLCELSLLSYDCAQQSSSLVASAALCLAIACLRCGLWRNGSPGPSLSPSTYWTATMTQATGYTRDQLVPMLGYLQAEHEQAAAELRSQPVRPVGGGAVPFDTDAKYETMWHKFSHPRFLGVLDVPPFTPHYGGTLLSPSQRRNTSPASSSTPLS